MRWNVERWTRSPPDIGSGRLAGRGPSGTATSERKTNIKSYGQTIRILLACTMRTKCHSNIWRSNSMRWVTIFSVLASIKMLTALQDGCELRERSTHIDFPSLSLCGMRSCASLDELHALGPPLIDPTHFFLAPIRSAKMSVAQIKLKEKYLIGRLLPLFVGCKHSMLTA